MWNTWTACPIFMCDTWKLYRILWRFQIWTLKYKIPYCKKIIFWHMQINWLYGSYHIQAGKTSRGPNLQSIISLSSGDSCLGSKEMTQILQLSLISWSCTCVHHKVHATDHLGCLKLYCKGLVTLIKILLKIVWSKIFMESSRNLQPTHTVKDPGVLWNHFQSLLNLL